MEKKPERSYRNLYFTVFIANLPYFAVGNTAGWSSPSIPIITAENFYLKVTPEQAVWIVSLMPLGGFLGPLITGWLLDVVGRKWSITMNMAINLSGCIFMACAWTIEILYLGRFLCGLSAGITFTTVPIYIAEISEPTMRGMLNNLGLITRSMTIIVSFSIGPYVSYLTLLLWSCICPSLFFILIKWMPESPYFLIAKGKKEKAEKSLIWLRGEMPQNVLSKEINEIQVYIEKSTTQKGSFKDLFSKQYRRIVSVIFVLLIFSQLVGMSIVLFYLQSIFEMTGSSLSPTFSVILVGAAMLSSSFFVPVIAKSYGFKKPMAWSSFGLGICLVVLAGCFWFRNQGIEFPVLNYIPVASMLLYIIIMTSGMMNLPWALAGEVLPASIKAQASAISGSFTFLVGFISVITFPDIANTFGMDIGFCLYASFCFLSAIFIFLFVPETKGLTLSEIQDIIKPPQKTNSSKILDINSNEQVRISYLTNHFEIDIGIEGTYKSFNM